MDTEKTRLLEHKTKMNFERAKRRNMLQVSAWSRGNKNSLLKMCSSPQAPLLSTDEFEVGPAGNNSVRGPLLTVGFVLVLPPCLCRITRCDERRGGVPRIPGG